MKIELARWKTLLGIAWPLIVANSFWNLQLTIDRIFLGSFSTEALGAAMAVMGVFWVPMALLQQTASYVTTFVAQYVGAKENEKIGPCLWQSFYVSLIGGVAFLFLNLASPWFFSLVGHAASIQSLEIDYYNSLAYSALPTAIVAAASGFFTGLGTTRVVMKINFVGLLLNVILDYLLIFGNLGFPKLGIMGAGYATALAAYGAAIYGCILLFNSHNELKYRILSQWKIKASLIGQFLKFGIPSGLQWALEGMAFTVFLIIMGRLKNGDVALASSSIAVTVMMLSVLPSMGVAQAVMTLVGQYIGEKNPEKAAQTTWDGVKISSLYMGSVAMSFILFPEFYLSWFQNQDNAALWHQVTQVVPTLLKVVAVFTMLDSMYLNVSFALKGAGDTRFVSLMALTVPWPLMVLPAFLVREYDNAIALSWSFAAIYSLVITTVLILRFRGGRWKTMSVING
ncbi:MAG: hypothetical protein COT73_11590 [Bdellovibrio sp. CG10_big_fil_rev_8_21_14_0_10_47_8]|nr:MAG: hypothetical protein COT73_11590 [Bdellovibrio sp. CG10_big_fil_rev_8_21_14_0_10_47_8]